MHGGMCSLFDVQKEIIPTYDAITVALAHCSGGHSGTCNLQRVPRPPVSLGQGVELVGILPNDMDTKPDLFLHNLNFNYQQTISPPPHPLIA